jgi:hypothetical protein
MFKMQSVNHWFNARNICEIYKCFILTIIAVCLVLNYFTPSKSIITFGDLREKRATLLDVPVVRIFGGSVDVSGTVDINQPIEVEIVR